MTTVLTECPMCHEKSEVQVDIEKYNNWRNGVGLVQNMFPDLSVEDREKLITGYCQKCWDYIFPAVDEWLEEDQ